MSCRSCGSADSADFRNLPTDTDWGAPRREKKKGGVLTAPRQKWGRSPDQNQAAQASGTCAAAFWLM
jgi:hypothetical protein